jgi:hypothetical protein
MSDEIEPQAPSRQPAVPAVGPVLGVIIGIVVFKLLPGDTSIFLGLVIVLVAVAISTYAAIEFTRWRARR